MDLVRKLVAGRGLPLPEIPEPEPFNADAPEELKLGGFGAVVFTGGFRPDYSPGSTYRARSTSSVPQSTRKGPALSSPDLLRRRALPP